MAVLTVPQARQYAAQAGFSGKPLDIIVAIAQAESGLRTDAQHVNNDGSLDRGILQINKRWHPEVSDSCAYNALCSFQQGYRISNSGTNFNPWSTYTSGLYLRYLSSGAGSGVTSGVGSKPWYSFPETHGYYTSYYSNIPDTPHFAVDIGTPLDTPFFFLESGTIRKADFQEWGGEVFLDVDAPGRPDEYVYHLDDIFVKPGQHVSAGQIIGQTGGQTSGGDHPTLSKWSTGPHAHFGEFTNYTDSPIGTIPQGPDPHPLLEQAKKSGLTGIGAGSESVDTTGAVTEKEKAPAPLAYKVNAILSEFPGFSGIALALDKASQFPGLIWYDPNTTVQDPRPWYERYLSNPAQAVEQDLATFNPDNYIGPAIRSIADTIISNTIPFLFRGVIVFIGLLLVAGLLWHAMDNSGIPEAIAEKGALLAA